jgi:hypothetical protein
MSGKAAAQKYKREVIGSRASGNSGALPSNRKLAVAPRSCLGVAEKTKLQPPYIWFSPG